MKQGWLLVVALAAGGCTDDEASDSSALLGVYAIDAWTENTTGCGAEGPSILADQQDSHLYLEVSEFFGQRFLAGDTCADVPGCQADAADTAFNLSGWAFERGSDAAGWEGRVTFAGSGGPDTACTGTVTDLRLTSAGGDAVQLRSERRNVAGFARDAEGFCDLDAAQAAAEGQPCDELEVIAATRVAEL